MKATLTFNLDNPEDRMAHLRCVRSLDMAIALFEIVHNAHRHADSVDVFRERILEATKSLNIDELIN